MADTIKMAISNFLATSHYSGDFCCEADFCDALFFLRYIGNGGVSIDGSAIFSGNHNWFWDKINDSRREALIADVSKVKVFDNSDKGYANIVHRYCYGDGYGVLKPAPRVIEEPFDENAFIEAANYYKLFADGIAYRPYAYKLIYCRKRGVPFIEAYLWDLCERVLQRSLNYREYKIADSVFYDTPESLRNIWLTKECHDIIYQMSSLLDKDRRYAETHTRNLVGWIVSGHQYRSDDGDLSTPSKYLHELYDLYECPEGCSEDVKEERKEALSNALGKISKEVLGDIEAWERKNRKV